MGRSDIFLKLEIIKKVIGILAILCTMWISAKAMAYSLLVTSFLSQIINSWPNRELLNYDYIQQLKDILPNIILAFLMGLCIYPIQFVELPNMMILGIQIFVGTVIYVGGSILLKFDSLYYIWESIKYYILKAEREAILPQEYYLQNHQCHY
jgi:hypothetical protein